MLWQPLCLSLFLASLGTECSRAELHERRYGSHELATIMLPAVTVATILKLLNEGYRL